MITNDDFRIVVTKHYDKERIVIQRKYKKFFSLHGYIWEEWFGDNFFGYQTYSPELLRIKSVDEAQKIIDDYIARMNFKITKEIIYP